MRLNPIKRYSSTPTQRSITFFERILTAFFAELSPISTIANPAVGPKNQSRYVNGVIKISTRLSPNQLLKKLHEIEDAHGRIRNVRWGPRTLDLDILLYGSRMMNTKKLTIPHPEMKIRNFVLTPLADIEPDLVLPDGSILSSLLENNQLKEIVPILPGDVIEKIG